LVLQQVRVAEFSKADKTFAGGSSDDMLVENKVHFFSPSGAGCW